jgi:hypothetical protein
LQGQKEEDARAHQPGVEQPEAPVINPVRIYAGWVGSFIHVGIRKANWFANARLYGGAGLLGVGP